jgi:two-component system response regulator
VILLVEDNANDDLLTVRALKKHGFDQGLVVARDGAEALDYLFASGTYSGRDELRMPRVILLDLKLPKVDGLEVLRRVRQNERTRHIPIVVLSSSIEERDLVASYELGANSYVRKPVNFDSFVEAMRHLGAYWLTLNEVVGRT